MTLSVILKKYEANCGSKEVNVIKVDSPVGEIIACADENHLLLVTFEDTKNFEKRFEVIAEECQCKFIEKPNKILESFQSEMKLYFEGKLKSFNVPVRTFGSDFQKEVWEKLLKLPYGSTQSYGDLAKEMGRPSSHSRAVGAACGANAHLIVIPCHRLVASGSKGGFNSGKDRKEWLLNHEKKCSS
ncbi:methylated-DNA--protein-cysteine methyltransferase, inducible [Aricia agestis]|uniref:methylated-DNA--protein-cysteine methyltransferase, inducible n=1 Tax=Aricia agestis TaxID=91739 RepID=UPI001C20AECE|nr:methylated-DNA--protein-cysteine methyltransferase, inducible [Aricia agestis]